MSTVGIVAVWLATIIGSRQSAPAVPAVIVPMAELTVPVESLPTGCRLSPAPTSDLGNGRIRMGLWAEFPANPWIGNDRHLLASMRQLIEGPVKIPDGPPPDARDLAGFIGQLADGVEEGYGAVYQDPDGRFVIVRAVRLAPLERPRATALPRSPTESSGASLVAIGQTHAVVIGNGQCFHAVEAHLKSLAR